MKSLEDGPCQHVYPQLLWEDYRMDITQSKNLMFPGPSFDEIRKVSLWFISAVSLKDEDFPNEGLSPMKRVGSGRHATDKLRSWHIHVDFLVKKERL